MMNSKSMRWGGPVACMGKKRNVYRILVGKSEETTTETQI
jgi:hypothetical protein